MSKKKSIKFRQNEDMQDIDSELDTAMDQLDGVNTRIEDLLTKFDSGEELPVEDQPSKASSGGNESPQSTSGDTESDDDKDEFVEDDYDDEDDEDESDDE